MNLNALINMIFQKNPQFRNNPLIQNAINLAQSNDVNALQNLAENVCKEKGVDINQAKQQVMTMFGGMRRN